MKITFFLLSTFSIMWWVQCAEHSCPETDVDFAGSDIDALHNVLDWHDCGQACELVSSCLFWTYNTSDKRCILKYSDAGLCKDSAAISGTRGCT